MAKKEWTLIDVKRVIRATVNKYGYIPKNSFASKIQSKFAKGTNN